MVLRKLALSNLLAHRMRTGLTAAAIALSVSLVVSVTGGYASVEGAAYKFFSQYLGNIDATITPANFGAVVPESLVDELRKDGRVKRVTGRFETENGLSGEHTRVAEIFGVDPSRDEQLNLLRLEAGKWFNSADGDVAVIDQGLATQQKLKVDDDLVLPGIGDDRLTVTIVGIVHKPDVMAQFRPSAYLPLHTLQQFKKFGPNITKINVELKDSTQADDFGKDWERKLEQIAPNVRIHVADQGRQILGQNLQVLHLVSYMGGVISMAAAMFIIFSTLTMGVSERQRTLAMLRAIGAFRVQIGWLVVLEGLLIATAGAIIGTILGWTWLHLLAWRFKELFYAGAILSWGGVLFGVLGSVIAALIASALPAWQASRVTALEAMSPMAAVPAHRLPWISALIGLALVAIDPVVVHGPFLEKLLALLHVGSAHDATRPVRFYLHFFVGLETGLAGFFLLSPLFVWLFDVVFAPVLAVFFGLRLALLRHQLSSGLWRAAGTCTALMVGLIALIVLQTEGRTALNGWKLPDKFPDVFIVNFSGIDLADASRLEDVPGIKPGEVMPIAIASPGLPPGYFTLAGLMVMPDRTMFIGIDPDRAFKLMELDFREGNAADAQRMLKMGRHILVTTEFRQLKGLGLGNTLPLKTNHGWETYTIAGVVWSPGIDVIVSVFDLGRQMQQRTAASVFGSIADAQRDFGVKQFQLFAANLEYFTDKEQVLKDVQKALRSQGMRAGDVRQIKFRIEQTFYNLLLLVSTVAFAAMAVAALGVTNTVMASIRSRRWQFGILRSIGVTRWQLLRLVLAEALLLGAVAVILGTIAGFDMSWNAEAMVVVLTGYKPPLVIPWNYVALGGGIILGVSLIASLWPAAWVARTQPLDLLQAGRAAT